MTDPPRIINLDTLIAQANADIEQARQQEQVYAAEVARAQGMRATAEAWRARLLALLDPPAAEEPAP